MAVRASQTREIKIALVGYLALSALQLAAYFVTGLLVMLAIAFESLASLLIAALLLFAVMYSEKPADEVHMFGYGRAQNVAAVVSAVIFISFMSIETIRGAISRFLNSDQTGQTTNIILPLIVTAVSLLGTAIPLLFILRSRTKNASLRAQMISSLEDVVSYGVGMIALVLVAKGYGGSAGDGRHTGRFNSRPIV